MEKPPLFSVDQQVLLLMCIIGGIVNGSLFLDAVRLSSPDSFPLFVGVIEGVLAIGFLLVVVFYIFKK